MSAWHYPTDIYLPPDLLDFTGSELLTRLLVQRGISTMGQARPFLDPTYYLPTSAHVFPDMAEAVERLQQAIDQQETICVWGDFDADGQTSTTLLVSMLRHLGGQVSYYIPNRLTESHGIKLPALERILAQGVGLIVTCDTGIAAHEAVSMAKTAGVDVIITDHHDLDETLPPAHAVINPKRLPETHPLRELPGVGVAYKLAEALYSAMSPTQSLDHLLDLVALGIVADIAKQTGDTRYLLQQGLPILSQTRRVGLRRIIENSRLKSDRLTEEHIGFWIGPRLNALGRLGDANLAVELLTTTDTVRANLLATQLEGLNEQRKLLVEQVTNEALAQIETTPSLLDYNALVLAGPNWHPGVIGIAASRLVEKFGRPTILIALQGSAMLKPTRSVSHASDSARHSADTVSAQQSRATQLGRGSARSVAGCDIHQAIKSQADLLVSFGGHPMAAGLALPVENILPFRRGLSEALAGCQETTESQFKIDTLVSLNQLSIDLLTTIQRLAPFGNGNPSVLLACQGVTIVNETVFGKQKAHKRVLIADDNGHQQTVIWWGGVKELSPEGRFDLAFTISRDDFRGGDAIQLEWQAARQWQTAVELTVKPTLVDWQHQPNLVTQIQQLPACMVWGEATSPVQGVTFQPRYQLQPCQNLILWTVPPDDSTYQQTVLQTQPHQIFLVGRDSAFDQLPAFIRQLMGLIKYSLQHKHGIVTWAHVAAALGHTIATTRLGVDWLVAQGKLLIQSEGQSRITVQPTQHPPQPSQVTTIEAQLTSALAETSAYRRFFRDKFKKDCEKQPA
ncbi:single-stranded-DNA-specific exonuclease RecJ [Anaerolineales bacterium HSG6]|nr:single-stranded-DNA-specific exonuclease RecJ [Anaerolineales bacterium HSG6]